jgi:hypothetical protein
MSKAQQKRECKSLGGGTEGEGEGERGRGRGRGRGREIGREKRVDGGALNGVKEEKAKLRANERN